MIPSCEGSDRNTSIPDKLKGVCKNKKTDRYEAHVWYKRKGFYLGSFQKKELAAEAVDLAHLKLGRGGHCLNYRQGRYQNILQDIQSLSFLELVELLRRQSCGFSRGSAKYRGVSKRAEDKWEARIGSFMGRSYTYLGTFSTGQAAARAYDVVAVLTHGASALTNFGMQGYQELSECVKALTPRHHMQLQEYFLKNMRNIWPSGCDENAEFWKCSICLLLNFCQEQSITTIKSLKRQEGFNIEEATLRSHSFKPSENSEKQLLWKPKVKKFTIVQEALLPASVMTSFKKPARSCFAELELFPHKAVGLNKICTFCGNEGCAVVCTCLDL